MAQYQLLHILANITYLFFYSQNQNSTETACCVLFYIITRKITGLIFVFDTLAVAENIRLSVLKQTLHFVGKSGVDIQRHG